MNCQGQCHPFGKGKTGQAYCFSAKPNIRKATMPTPTCPVIFISTFETSRERTCPPSRRKKPACIRKIRLPIESSQSE